MNNRTPDIALMMSPNHMTGKKRSSSDNGTFRAIPKIRRSTTAFVPARKPIPIAWMIRTVGNASSELDSRSHMLSVVLSIQAVYATVIFALLLAGWRGGTRVRAPAPPVGRTPDFLQQRHQMQRFIARGRSRHDDVVAGFQSVESSRALQLGGRPPLGPEELAIFGSDLHDGMRIHVFDFFD